MARHVAPCDVQTPREMIQHVPVEDAHHVRNAVTAVHDHTGGRAARVERQHGLRLALQSGEVELFEHDFGHFATVLLRV